MVKKSQIRFVAFTTSIIFIFFGLLFGIIVRVLKNDFNGKITDRLDEVSASYLANPSNFYSAGFTLISVQFFSTSNNEFYYNVLTTENNLSRQEIDHILKSKSEHNFSYGSVGNVFFKKFNDTKQNLNLILLADMSENISDYNDIVVSTLIYMAVTYLLIFIVAVIASFSIFKPVKDTLSKQRRFISDASHELKTPVAIISANADVLKSENGNKYIDSIKAQTERINFLVSDMLTLARMDEYKIKINKEHFSLTDETNSIVFPFEAVAFEKNKTMQFDIDENLSYFGDKLGFKQIVSILTDNAVKYSSENGVIKISLKKDGNKTAFTVFNSGSNILQSDVNKIFERFFRGDDSRTRETGGNGLGLAIASDIAKNNKWKLTAKSVYNESMTITLIL